VNDCVNDLSTHYENMIDSNFDHEICSDISYLREYAIKSAIYNVA